VFHVTAIIFPVAKLYGSHVSGGLGGYLPKLHLFYLTLSIESYIPYIKWDKYKLKKVGPRQYTKYRNNLFDNDIKDQGHSVVILPLDTFLGTFAQSQCTASWDT
jgi:hypothetical protein